MEHDLVVEGKVALRESVQDAQVGISDGLIREIKKQGLKGSRTIRARECLVFPGFIDSHVHLREPGWEHKEDFRTGTMAAIHGGVTTVLDMPNNPNPSTTEAALKEKARLAMEKALVDVRFFGGVEDRSLDEIPRIASAVVGYKLYLARTTGGLVFPEADLGRAFSEIANTDRPVSLHCEDKWVIETAAKALTGVDRPDVYCDLRPAEAEIESVRKTAAATRKFRNLKANICHTSTDGALKAILESRKEGGQLSCEAALHHLFYSRKAMLKNSMLRMNPPLRPEADRAALVEGIKNGTVSFLVTDHAPHLVEEKVSEGLAGVPGLDDYGHMLAWLIRSQGLDPVVATRVTSGNPATFFGLRDRGEIAVGKRADLSILDVHSPEKVSSDMVLSKCGWSPYEGVEFPGRIRWTIREGTALLEDFQQTGG